MNCLKNESGQETDPNLQNDNQVADDENELNLEDLVKERDELKDKLMRSLAESEKYQKRALKDRQDSRGMLQLLKCLETYLVFVMTCKEL